MNSNSHGVTYHSVCQGVTRYMLSKFWFQQVAKTIVTAKKKIQAGKT